MLRTPLLLPMDEVPRPSMPCLAKGVRLARGATRPVSVAVGTAALPPCAAPVWKRACGDRGGNGFERRVGYRPRGRSETYATADIVAYDGTPRVKVYVGTVSGNTMLYNPATREHSNIGRF